LPSDAIVERGDRDACGVESAPDRELSRRSLSRVSVSERGLALLGSDGAPIDHDLPEPVERDVLLESLEVLWQRLESMYGSVRAHTCRGEDRVETGVGADIDKGVSPAEERSDENRLAVLERAVVDTSLRVLAYVEAHPGAEDLGGPEPGASVKLA
jgi:hypothetical protein